MHSSFTQLRNALARRQQQGVPLQLFLRDDDVTDDEPSLRRLLTLCARHTIPINLGVIPGRLTAAGIAVLNDYVQQQPGLLELNQHGWQHVNHEPTGKKCEFGPSRDYAAQLADLAAGQAKMNEAFGAQWSPVFVPPWNRCTAVTARALAQLGFRALSRDAGQAPLPDCREVPVTLDLFRWRGGAVLRAADELADELAQQIASTDRVGLLLHHQVLDDAAFALLDEWLRLFNQFPIVRRHTFQSLLDPC